MIDKLERLVEDALSLNSKLILLISPPDSGKSMLLGQLAERMEMRPLNLGIEFVRKLLLIPQSTRHLYANSIFKEISDEFSHNKILIIDNLEVLFDRALELNPLDLLKQHAHARRVVAAWPGELRGGRLLYAKTGHPEYRDYGVDGLVPFKTH